MYVLTGCLDSAEAQDIQRLQRQVIEIDRPEECAVATISTGSIADARTIYDDICAGFPRPDCDMAPDGGFICASAQLGSNSPPWVLDKRPLNVSLSGEQVADVLPEPPVFEQPELPTVDPEPSPVVGSTVRLEAESDDATMWVNSGTSQTWRGTNHFLMPPNTDPLTYRFQVTADGVYQVTIRARAANQTPGRQDLHNDAWVRMDGEPVEGFIDARNYRKMFSSGNGSFNRASNLELGPQKTAFRQFLRAGAQYQIDVLGRSNFYEIDYFEVALVGDGQPAPAPLPPEVVPNGDLFVLHYDVCPDADDIHAMVANYAILDGLRNVSVQAAVGTCGIDIRNRYRDDGESLFFKLYPDGLNVADDLAGSIASASTVWEAVLDAGNRVLVAEGGQSDYTASVVRALGNRSDLNRITVVQHAPGYNEGNTLPANLTYLRNTVNYVNIDNGNSNGNSTANLASWQAGLIDPRAFVSSALDSVYADLWAEAFSILNPSCLPQSFVCRVDFSDTVELLHLVGDSSTSDINSFAAEYFVQ